MMGDHHTIEGFPYIPLPFCCFDPSRMSLCINANCVGRKSIGGVLEVGRIVNQRHCVQGESTALALFDRFLCSDSGSKS